MSLQSVRPARVSRVAPGSIAEEVGFEPGDALVSINGQTLRDLIDYRFLCADEALTLEVLDVKGIHHQVEIEKDIDEDLGLEFESALFDGLIQCNNRCPFCFIDQQPPGRRHTLYLKDDDYRLSFLYGSYLTLTNLLPQDWRRIAQMRLSPLYVSVHATEADVRIRLLKNPRAGEILKQLDWFCENRLQIHAQVVVCPGINDGPQLEKTLRELARFNTGELPTVISAAVVPVGLTRYRPEIDELVPVSLSTAQAVIASVQHLQAEFRHNLGNTFAWLADEWFLIGQQPLPSESHYENYPQIGNGVGSIRQFLNQLAAAASTLPEAISPARTLTWVVGNAVEHALQPTIERLNQVEGLTVRLQGLASQYWGQEITVTGLLTGQDLIAGLQDKPLGNGILLPSLMLKQDDQDLPETTVFLDDMTLAEVARQLDCPIWPVKGAADLIEACCHGLSQKHPGDDPPAPGYWAPS